MTLAQELDRPPYAVAPTTTFTPASEQPNSEPMNPVGLVVEPHADVIVEVTQVSKTYGVKVALANIDLEFKRGETTVLMGPNGAGKTTLMEMLCGLHAPDAGGKISAFGRDITLAAAEHRSRIGVQLQETQLFARATAREYLNFFRSLYKRALSVQEVSNWLNLDAYLDTEIRQLSGGMAQRVALALAVINDPDIILLDEPTVGLDPLSRRDLWSCLQQMKQRNKTLIFTTHYMDEAVNLADRVIMLAEGRVVFNGTPAQITAKVQELSASLDDVFAYYVNRTKE